MECYLWCHTLMSSWVLGKKVKRIKILILKLWRKEKHGKRKCVRNYSTKSRRHIKHFFQTVVITSILEWSHVTHCSRWCRLIPIQFLLVYHKMFISSSIITVYLLSLHTTMILLFVNTFDGWNKSSSVIIHTCQ